MATSTPAKAGPRSSPPRQTTYRPSWTEDRAGETSAAGSLLLSCPSGVSSSSKATASSSSSSSTHSPPPASTHPTGPSVNYSRPDTVAQKRSSLGFSYHTSVDPMLANAELREPTPLVRRPSFSRSPHSLPPTIPLPAVPSSSSSHAQGTIAPSTWSTSPVTRSSALPNPAPSIPLAGLPPTSSQRSSWALDVPSSFNGRPPSSYSGSLALMHKSITRRRSSLGLGEGPSDQPDPSPPTSRAPSLKRRPSYSPTPPPSIPLPPIPPSSPHSLQPLNSPSASILSYASSQTGSRPSSFLYNPPPHPPPSGPLPTLPKGPSTFRGMGRPASGAFSNRGQDSPLRGVYGDGSPVREFFAASSSPPSPKTKAPSSPTSEVREREQLLAKEKKERRFDLREGKMLNARIITDSMDARPISPAPLSVIKASSGSPTTAPAQSVIPPTPSTATTPRPSVLLPRLTPLSPKPLPLLPPPPKPTSSTTSTPKSSTGPDSVPLSMTSPSSSSEYSNRSSTFSTVSSRSSASSYGHLLPSVSLLQQGGPSIKTSILAEEPLVESPAERSDSPDVKNMTREARRRESSVVPLKEAEDDDGWADSLVEVYLTAQDSEESDGDLTGPLSNLQTHFLSPDARLPTLGARRVSSASIPVRDAWGSSTDDTSGSEDDFAPISPQDRKNKGKGRASLPPPGSPADGAAKLLKRKMSHQLLLGSFPRPPSTPTGSRPSSFTSAASSSGSPSSRNRESTTSSTPSNSETNRTSSTASPPTSYRPTSDSSTAYSPRPSLGRPLSTASIASSRFSVGTADGSVFSVGGRLLPRPRRGDEDAELGDVWGGVEVPHEGAGGEKEWEKAAELLRERKTLSVQVPTVAGPSAALRRVASAASGKPGIATRKVSNGSVTVGMLGPAGGAADGVRQSGPPVSMLNRKPVPALGPDPPPAAASSGIPVTPIARRTASTSQLRPPASSLLPTTPSPSIPARTSSIAFPRPAPSGLRPPTQRAPSSSLPPPTSLLVPKASLAYPPTEPLRIIKKNASSATLRPPSMISFASSGSGSGSAGGELKRRMSKVPMQSVYRMEGDVVLRSS